MIENPFLASLACFLFHFVIFPNSLCPFFVYLFFLFLNTLFWATSSSFAFFLDFSLDLSFSFLHYIFLSLFFSVLVLWFIFSFVTYTLTYLLIKLGRLKMSSPTYLYIYKGSDTTRSIPDQIDTNSLEWCKSSPIWNPSLQFSYKRYPTPVGPQL